MIRTLDGIGSKQFVTSAEELFVIAYTEIERRFPIRIIIGILPPVSNRSTLRARLFPVAHISQPLIMSQLRSHRHLQISIRERRQHDGHITIHTPDDIIHINSRIDAEQKLLDTLIGLHHRQEFLTIHIHKDTSSSIIRH